MHWDLNHFVVLAKVGKKKVTIFDLAFGKRELSHAEVSDHFTGVALELTPTAEFKPQKAAPNISFHQLTGRVTGLWRSLALILALSVTLQVFVIFAPFFMQWVVDQVPISADRSPLTVLGLGFALVLQLQVSIGLLSQGLDPDDNPGIAPLTDPDNPPAALPQAVTDLEALFDFIIDVILRDQILVDDKYHDAWFGDEGPLAELAQRSIVRPHPFLEHPERLDGPRREFVRRLVLNPTMAREQITNEAAWNQSDNHRTSSLRSWSGAPPVCWLARVRTRRLTRRILYDVGCSSARVSSLPVRPMPWANSRRR